ncbi:MAG: Sec-independent protein translocase subunit TatA/TatB [Limisphaerales bacterium]
MNFNCFAFLGWPEIMGILIVVLILFGAKKVPELMRGLGSGIKEFKKASREVQDEFERAIEDEPPRRTSPPTNVGTSGTTGSSPSSTPPVA